MSAENEKAIRKAREMQPLEELERKYNKAKGRHAKDHVIQEQADLIFAKYRPAVSLSINGQGVPL